MLRRIGFLALLSLLVALFISFTYFRVPAIASTPKLVSSSSTFTILAGSTNHAYDQNGKPILKPARENGHSLIALNASLNRRTAELPVGTVIQLYFPKGASTFTVTPNRGVVEKPQGMYMGMPGIIALLKVVGQGSATITVTTLYNATSNLYAGYNRTTGSTLTDITSQWVVPTASSCSSVPGGYSTSSTWPGIGGWDSQGIGHIIQAGTLSNCWASSSAYWAWLEIYPDEGTQLLPTPAYTIHAGDQMSAEVKQNSGSNWTITLKDLTTGWASSSAQIYTSSQSASFWMLENPQTNSSNYPLTNFGSVSFVNDTQNGANPNHNYTTDAMDLVDANNVPEATTSQPNINANGFSVFYCDPINGCPTTYPPGGWTNEGNMSYAEYGQEGVLLPDGKVFVAGGINSSDRGTSQTMLFTDGTPGSWASRANMSTDRKLGFMLQPVTISGGGSRVLAAGGASDACSCIRNTAELYNESTNTWTNTPNMNAARIKYASSILSDGRVLVTGGDSSTGDTSSLASTEIYDPVANTWTSKASMSSAREGHMQVTFTDSGGNTKVMVIGGYKYASGWVWLSSTEIYNPSTDTWSAGPSMAYAHGWSNGDAPRRATLLHDGRILVSDTHSEVYNPSTNSWTTYSMPTSYVAGGAAVLLGSGANYKVLFAGGGVSPYKQAMLFDPSTNAWSVTTNTNYGHSFGTLTTLTSGNVLAAGGSTSSSNSSNTSEEYTP